MVLSGLIMMGAPVRPGFVPGGGAATCDARKRDRALAEPKRQRRTTISRCAAVLGIARSDYAGTDADESDPARLQHQARSSRVSAAVDIVEDSLDAREILLQSGAL